ncbi:hypothetical protein ACIQHY_12640 [Streptomyces sp. NPDC092359]|uniref:hypothetical protein n=1 Tax=Streptomyces sp. NPDC092359 TaxID=3366014 RepID=UPI0037FA5CDA
MSIDGVSVGAKIRRIPGDVAADAANLMFDVPYGRGFKDAAALCLAAVDRSINGLSQQLRNAELSPSDQTLLTELNELRKQMVEGLDEHGGSMRGHYLRLMPGRGLNR